jgi:hypothetical protein
MLCTEFSLRIKYRWLVVIGFNCTLYPKVGGNEREQALLSSLYFAFIFILPPRWLFWHIVQGKCIIQINFTNYILYRHNP